MRKPSLDFTISALEPWAEKLEQVPPKPGHINRLAMLPLADGKRVPRRIPRTLDDVRGWFWTKGVRQPNGCLVWAGPKSGGYGCCRISGKKRRAHRVAFFLANGFLPTEKIVCHKCDNPFCIEPTHLFLGLDKDNFRDAMSKGRARWLRGEEVGNHKLTAENVRTIRSSPLSALELSRMFNVIRRTIYGIRKHKTWKHIKSEPES